MTLVAVVSLAAAGPSAGAAYAVPTVNVFPMPGSQVAPTHAQLVFRGVPATQLGNIVVTGSVSGVHTGSIAGDSDGDGGSFLPTVPFTPGETVTVNTSLPIVGAVNGTYQFTVAVPLHPIRKAVPQFARRVKGDVQGFRSRPDLHPVSVQVTTRASHTAPGYIFTAPQAGPMQDGAMIFDSSGHLVWFQPVARNTVLSDFREQTYRGAPVLTWWQGSWNGGVGRGVDVVENASYQRVAVVRAVNGMDADLHEFQLTRENTALITSYYPVYWNTSAVRGGSAHDIVFDSVVQEIDVPTGLLLFQWDSLDHVPVTASEGKPPKDPGHPFDYFHINSVAEDLDGNLIVSARNTWAAYKVSRQTGAVIWTLGGKASSFRFGRGAAFAYQHDVRVRAAGDSIVTMFDDGAGPPDVHRNSRALELALNLKTMTATRVAEDDHSPSLLADFEGNDQQLPNGDDLVGWGQWPYVSEYSNRGRVLFDAHLVGANSLYRAYRFGWTGTPTTPPALAVQAGKRGSATAYASWNGATGVASWRVLGGSSAHALRILATARRSGFETAIRIPSQPYVEAQALDSHGHALGTSGLVRPS
jgi:hypothetical protein